MWWPCAETESEVNLCRVMEELQFCNVMVKVLSKWDLNNKQDSRMCFLL
jgi:hypothetical protein